MGWFTPKLEPGERVVLRSPSFWWQWPVPLGWASFPLWIWLGINLTSDNPWPNDDQDWLLLKFYAGLGAISACLHFPQYRWRLMVTDRRLIARKGWLRSEIESIPLGRIYRLRPSEAMNGFGILCGGEVHAVEGGLLDFHQLHKALGERVVTRQPKRLVRGWRWVVTNRRFLHYAPPQPVEEMNLDDIQEVVQEPYVPYIVLRGDGREIAIRCFDDDDSGKVLAALGRDPAEALP